MVDRSDQQQLLTHLADLLRGGDEIAALRLWRQSSLASDPLVVARFGRRMDEIAARFGRPAAFGTPIADLQQALIAGDTEAVLGRWIALRGHPDLPLGLASNVNAHLERALGAALRRALARNDDDVAAGIARAADAASAPLPDDLRRAARDAARRDATRRDLDTALNAGDRAALADLALSGRLDDLGRLTMRAERAVARAVAWPHLRQALDADDDVAILGAYDPDLYDDDPDLPDHLRQRVVLAQRRIGWLHRVRLALRRRDARALAALTADPPPFAADRLSHVEQTRIDRLIAQDAAADRLVRALREGPDDEVLAALNAIGAAGAPLPDAVDWSAVRGVVDRISLAHAIREAAGADPPDHARLARLLPAARASGADLGSDGIDLGRLEADLLRAGHVARLRDALATGDDRAIAHAAHPDPHDAISRLTPEEQARVRRSVARA